MNSNEFGYLAVYFNMCIVTYGNGRTDADTGVSQQQGGVSDVFYRTAGIV